MLEELLRNKWINNEYNLKLKNCPIKEYFKVVYQEFHAYNAKMRKLEMHWLYNAFSRTL